MVKIPVTNSKSNTETTLLDTPTSILKENQLRRGPPTVSNSITSGNGITKKTRTIKAFTNYFNNCTTPTMTDSTSETDPTAPVSVAKPLLTVQIPTSTSTINNGVSSNDFMYSKHKVEEA